MADIIPTWGSGLTSVTQKEMLARRFAITPRKLWLYKDGDECVNVTGGWGISGYAWTADAGVNMESFTKQTKSIYVFPSYNAFTRRMIGTLNQIDLTNHSKLFIELSITNTNKNGCRIIASSSKNINWSGNVGRIDKIGTMVKVIDIKNISGSFYLSFNNRNNENEHVTGYISKIWLE